MNHLLRRFLSISLSLVIIVAPLVFSGPSALAAVSSVDLTFTQPVVTYNTGNPTDTQSAHLTFNVSDATNHGITDAQLIVNYTQSQGVTGNERGRFLWRATTGFAKTSTTTWGNEHVNLLPENPSNPSAGSEVVINTTTNTVDIVFRWQVLGTHGNQTDAYASYYYTENGTASGWVQDVDTFDVSIIQAVPSSNLIAEAVNNPASSLLLAGATNQTVARYRFQASGEAFIVNRLTLINRPRQMVVAQNLIVDPITTTGSSPDTIQNFCASGDIYNISTGDVIVIPASNGTVKQVVTNTIYNTLACDNLSDVNIVTNALANLPVAAGTAVEISDEFGSGEPISAIQSVHITYNDINGLTQTASGTLTSGSTTLSGLAIYVPANQSTTISISADVNSLSLVGDSISGQRLRIGIKEAGNNTINRHFEAVGQSSGDVKNFNTGYEISNSSSVNEFVVRTTRPTFQRIPVSSQFTAGNRELYRFSVSADSAGAVGLARITFQIDKDQVSNLSNFELYRNSTLINSNVLITEVTPAQPPINLQGINPQLVGNQTEVVVSFNQDETIPTGSTYIYSLRANVNGVGPNGFIRTALVGNDELNQVNWVSRNNNLNQNTARIFDISNVTSNNATGTFDDFQDSLIPTTARPGATVAIYDSSANSTQYCQITSIDNFSTPSVQTNCPAIAFSIGDSVTFVDGGLFSGSADFAQASSTNRNIIWSDRSASFHAHPTVNGTVVSGSGSYDWTNGYLLTIDESPQFLFTN